MKSKRFRSALLPIGFFLFAWGIRLTGVSWGLPALYDTDEPLVVERALILPKTQFDPNYYIWPGHLPMYVHFVNYGTLYAVGRLMGGYADPWDFALQYFSDPTRVIRSGRILQSAADALTVMLLFLIGRDHFGRWAGIFAALLWTLQPVAYEQATLIRPDAIGLLCLVLSLKFALASVDRPGWGWLIAAGLAAGAAISCKYSLWIGAGLVPLVALVTPGRSAGGRLARAVGAGAAAVVGCALTGPYLFAHPERVLAAKQTIARLWQSPPGTIAIGWGGTPVMLYHVLGVGAVVFVVAVLIGARKELKIWLLTVPVLVAYLTMLGQASMLIPRFILPVMPYLLLMAAVGAARAAEHARISVRARGPARAAAALLLLAMPAWALAGRIEQKMLPDVREVAADWIRANIEPGTPIVMESFFLCPAVESRGQYQRRVYARAESSMGGEGGAFYRNKSSLSGFLDALPPSDYKVLYVWHNVHVSDVYAAAKEDRARYLIRSTYFRDFTFEPDELDEAERKVIEFYRAVEPHLEPLRVFVPEPHQTSGRAIEVYRIRWDR